MQFYIQFQKLCVDFNKLLHLLSISSHLDQFELLTHNCTTTIITLLIYITIYTKNVYKNVNKSIAIRYSAKINVILKY